LGAAEFVSLGFGSPGFIFGSQSVTVVLYISFFLGPWRGSAYLPLQRADLEPREDLARLVAVADVLEGFGGVHAGEVEEHLLAASALQR
jgi:hypothetical protein